MGVRLALALFLLVIAVWDTFSSHPWVAVLPAFAAGVLVARCVYERAAR